MAEKIGEITKTQIMEVIKTALEAAGYDVLKVGSGAFGVPAVEGENETAVKIVVQVPKGERGGTGYDVFEDAQAYTFKCEEAEKKRKKKEEDKAKKLAKQNKTE